jgi:hypothetical protein
MAITNTALYPGQHVYANPYTAAIDIRQLTFGLDAEATVYLYNTGTYYQWQLDSIANTAIGSGAGQYNAIPINTAGNNGLLRQIPSMQALLVKALNATSNATFGISYNMVVMRNTDLQKRIKGKKEDSTTNNLTGTLIEVDGPHYSDRMWLFSQTGCTHNFDNGWDGRKMFGSALAPQIFAVEPDGNYQVDAVDDINNTLIAFQPGEDTEYTLSFTHQNVAGKYARIYMLDLKDGKIIDITQSGSKYSFIADTTTTYTNRFLIITNKIEPDTTANLSKINIFNANGKFFVQNLSDEKGEFSLFDMSGRYLFKSNFNAYSVSEAGSVNQPGIYILAGLLQIARK